VKRIVDIQNWKRKEHYEFFKGFDEPYLGVVTEIDCTEAYEKNDWAGESFFLYYLHKATMAANEVEEFRYRIEDEQVVCYDKINASSTIGRDDETFGYSFIEFSKDYKQFKENARKEIEEIKNSTGLRLNEEAKRIDTIHFTTLPWIKITGLSHPRNFKYNDSVPKISFGSYYHTKYGKNMSVAIHANHALVDGFHVAKFVKIFQELMNQ
jgi:chloramphenicol O-acetyltransferase type A